MSPRQRKGDGEESPAPLHPLLTFNFEKDAFPSPKDSGRRRLERVEPPASITDALKRWLEEEL